MRRDQQWAPRWCRRTSIDCWTALFDTCQAVACLNDTCRLLVCLRTCCTAQEIVSVTQVAPDWSVTQVASDCSRQHTSTDCWIESFDTCQAVAYSDNTCRHSFCWRMGCTAQEIVSVTQVASDCSRQHKSTDCWIESFDTCQAVAYSDNTCRHSFCWRMGCTAQEIASAVQAG